MAIFEPLFEALGTTGVRYVVVGGLAVVLDDIARLQEIQRLETDDEA